MKPSPVAVADRMRHYIELSGMSRAEVARKMGVSAGAVTHWLNGRGPTVANISRFCLLVGVDLETFFGPLRRIPTKRAG
jgi:transcriptional regulator with XRE-family HTH domain